MRKNPFLGRVQRYGTTRTCRLLLVVLSSTKDISSSGSSTKFDCYNPTSEWYCFLIIITVGTAQSIKGKVGTTHTVFILHLYLYFKELMIYFLFDLVQMLENAVVVSFGTFSNLIEQVTMKKFRSNVLLL